jgi:hypothetical protein
MKKVRSVGGKPKDGVLFLRVEGAHCRDPAWSQSLDFAVHMAEDLLEHICKHNETYLPSVLEEYIT